MGFVFPGRILEEYTVRNNRLGRFDPAILAIRFSSTCTVSRISTAAMIPGDPNDRQVLGDGLANYWNAQ
jgi:hypothetical protein